MGPFLVSNPNMAHNNQLHQNHTETIQTGKTYIPFEVPSPLVGHPTAYRIFILGYLNPVHLKTIILNKGELVFDKERQTLSLSS